MRMTGPSLDPLLTGPTGLLNGCEPNKLPAYITAEMTNNIRMMQQIVYPPVVTASDVKFRMVTVSTITEMTNNMTNSYM